MRRVSFIFPDGNAGYLFAHIPRHVPLMPAGISAEASARRETLALTRARRKSEKKAAAAAAIRQQYADEYVREDVPDSVGFVADEEPSWRMASLVIAVPPRLVL